MRKNKFMVNTVIWIIIKKLIGVIHQHNESKCKNVLEKKKKKKHVKNRDIESQMKPVKKLIEK